MVFSRWRSGGEWRRWGKNGGLGRRGVHGESNHVGVRRISIFPIEHYVAVFFHMTIAQLRTTLLSSCVSSVARGHIILSFFTSSEHDTKILEENCIGRYTSFVRKSHLYTKFWSFFSRQAFEEHRSVFEGHR